MGTSKDTTSVHKRTESAEHDKSKGSTLGSLDYDIKKHGPRQIMGKVSGTMEIFITDCKARKTGSSKNPIFYYDGEFKSGSDAISHLKATILAFDRDEKEDVEMLHSRLNLVNHPYIIKSLGYESGAGRHKEYILLALSHFNKTFATYMEKSCKRTMQFGRFTEEFITLIKCVIIAILKLHDSGFYRPKLNERYIAVVKENSNAKAMLMDFCLLEKGNENAKDNDWVRLGSMLKRTAEAHESFNIEIEDLVRNLKNGTLKGMNILKHSALLSVRKKFENVLALSTFILTHCKKKSSCPDLTASSKLQCKAIDDEDNINAIKQVYCNSSNEAKITTFKNMLDGNIGWIENIPSWMRKKMIKHKGMPIDDTLREFVWRIRSLSEHEDKHLKETTKKISFRQLEYTEEESDLESEIREAWPFLFLNCQKFATSLGLKY